MLKSTMAWTEWRLLATPTDWFCGDLTHNGASCYELGTGGPRGGSIQIHYVGETSNEKSRGRTREFLANAGVTAKQFVDAKKQVLGSPLKRSKC